MNIIVCIKQVPGTSKVAMDEETGVLLRDGTEAKMNPYDLYAIEAAMLLKQQYGGTVSVITMGPPQAESVIREAFAMGADDGVLMTDRAFAGADVLATSKTLSEGIRKSFPDFDLIICGKQTTDGDTAQVGAEIAEFLDIPHQSGITEIVEAVGGSSNTSICIKADIGDYLAEMDISFPCLLAVEKDIHIPRLPSYRLQQATKDRAVKRLTLADLNDTDPEHYGLKYSPTQVERIFPPQSQSVRADITGNADGIAEELMKVLKDRKFA